MEGNTLKIPVLGIANAGKTSLVRTLQREFKSLSKLKPTKQIERSKVNFLNKDIICWDFGGQEKYRSVYQKKANMYFEGIEELFYVIDFQDQNSYNDSLVFFQEIIPSLQNYSPNATINLLINKIDPGMETEENVKTYDALSQKFSQVADHLPIRVCQTSIFNPISVIRAFSKPLFGNTTLYDNFSFLFMEFVNKTPAEFVIIFTKDFLEIGNYFSPYVNQAEMRDMAKEILQIFEDKKVKLNKIDLQSNSLSIQMMKFEAGNQPFFFTLGYKTAELSDPAPMLSEAYNLLEEIKKFMKYF